MFLGRSVDMRLSLAAIAASLTCALGLPAAAPAAGWAPAVHQPPDGWRTDDRTYSPSLAAAPDGRLWAAWDAGGDVLVSRRAAGGGFPAGEHVGAGGELPLPRLQALGAHGPAMLWNAPGGLAAAEPGPDGRYAEIPDPPFAQAQELSVRLTRLAGGGLLATWPLDGVLKASLLGPDGRFGTVADISERRSLDHRVIADGDGALVVWSERDEEIGTAYLRARTLGGDGALGDPAELDEQDAGAGAGTGRSGSFDVSGLVPRDGGWTLLTSRTFPAAGGGTEWRLEVRDGAGTAAQAARELDGGSYFSEPGGGVDAGAELDGAGGTLLHWRDIAPGEDRIFTLHRPAGGEFPDTPLERAASVDVSFAPLAPGRLFWLEYGQFQGERVWGGPATGAVLSDAPPPGAANVRPMTFTGDGAGHAFLAWDGALRVYDEAAPALSGVQVPATAAAGQAVRLAAAATDAWTGASVEWDFGDGATATGPQVDHAFAKPGRYDVRVSAVDAAGNRVSEVRAVQVPEAGGKVQPPPPPPPPPIVVEPLDRTAPVLSGAKVSGRRAAVRFSLSEAGTVDLRLYKEHPGVRRGGKCRTSAAAKRRGGKRCVRLVRSKRVEFQAAAGTVKRRVSGRRLGKGRYRVVVRVRDAAGNAAKRSTVKLKIGS